MMPFSDAALAVFVAWNAAVGGPPRPPSQAVAADSTPPSVSVLLAARPAGVTFGQQHETPADTVRRPRQKAIVYSDAYATRLTIHRRLAWAMLPLFAVSYITGDKILEDGAGAPEWARTLHRPAATGSAVLFGANTVTGYWNLWEGRKDPNNRTRKILHTVLFSAASAGFVYAGTQLADEAEQSQSKREQHRNVALGSMGVSTLSWLIMLIGN
jgi:hypothetical protein